MAWTLLVLCALVTPASVGATSQPPAEPPPATGVATVASTATASGAPGDQKPEPGAPQQTPPPAPEPPASKAPGAISRWFDLQNALVGVRYRAVENSSDVLTANQLQGTVNLRARLKFDRAGRYALVATLASGGAFTSGWNTTGVGTGDFVSNLYLKHLYVTAAPVKGIELGVGSMPFVRGEATEITTYDNDGYVAGERVSVKRPKDVYFDEIAATFGYVGDVSEPGFFSRHERMDEWNYQQVQATKKVGTFVSATGDFTRHAGVNFVRGAVAVRTPALRVVDSVRWEQYHRFGDTAGDGFAVFAEKAVHKRVTLGGGYGAIDQRFVPLNADRFGRGNRLFTSGAVKLIQDLQVQYFLGHAVHTDYAIANRTRFDLVLAYNMAPALNKALFTKY